MTRRSPPRKVAYFEPVLPRLAPNTIIESSFEVGRRFRCTMRIDCGQLDPGAVIRPDPGEWHPRMPERLDDEELADWRAGRNAVYQLAALTVGARLAVADALTLSRRRRLHRLAMRHLCGSRLFLVCGSFAKASRRFSNAIRSFPSSGCAPTSPRRRCSAPIRKPML